MMKVDPGLHHRLRYTFSMSGKVRNLREPASQALFCYALLSQTNDVERWWNDDENEPLCLVPLYILSIMGKPRTTPGRRRNEGAASHPGALGITIFYILQTSLHRYIAR